MKIISIDTETGGIGLDKSILSLGLVIADEELTVRDSFYVLCKPDDGIFRVTGKALEINKLDLIDVEKKGFSYKACGKMVYDFIKFHSDNGKDKLFPLGKNVAGDLSHIHDKLISRNTWETFCSYRNIELSGIVMYLALCGKIPKDLGSLSDICKYFQIDTSLAHNALGDARMNIEAFIKLTELSKKEK